MPRDILVKLSLFKVKERILLRVRQQVTVSFQEAHCTLYQDIAPATLARLQQFCPVAEALRAETLRYRWAFPFGLAFELHNKACHFTAADEAAAALGLQSESEGGDFAATGAMRGGVGPSASMEQWRQQRSGRKTPRKWHPPTVWLLERSWGGL
ncbi:hypothetical protein NDU88_005411 [Pleurodeles waltl]|uniref:Uncharacterized protein n=1 Tax=Pleurodeles waltl TaxID=8319 RepID=A0AAV7NMQ1_PLEWA|nr:hypothetical protein NDU88_005411 [Pleurodeles waltl]